MYKIIGADGKEYGPVSVEQLRQWFAENRINAQTRVQPEGDSEWKMLGEVLGIGASPVVTAPPGGQPPLVPDAGRHQLTEFSVAAVVLLNFCTCGLFSFVWLNLMHGKLPKVRPDDPSAARAIGFCFIPFYNLYWIFFTYRRLCLRIDEQRDLYGLPPGNLKGMATTACIFQIIPYLNFLVGYTIITPIFIGQLQSSVNELVRTSATTAPRAVLPTLAPASGMSGPGVALVVVCVVIIPIMVIGILAALLLPALSTARERAQRVACESNLKQLGLACAMYAADYHNKLPADHWCDALLPYLGNSQKVFLCPSGHAEKCAYVFNANMLGAEWQGDPNVVIELDGERGWNGVVSNALELPPSPHRQGYNVLFNDGHVAWVSNEGIKQLHWVPETK